MYTLPWKYNSVYTAWKNYKIFKPQPTYYNV
jgi:hypothetical protein